MKTSAYRYFGEILSVNPSLLEKLDSFMTDKFGKAGVLDRLMEKNELSVEKILFPIAKEKRRFEVVNARIRSLILEDEKELLSLLEKVKGKDEFERAASLARTIAKPQKGFFLRREIAEDIFRKRPPLNLMKHLGFSDIEELIDKTDVLEAFSALRFIESNKWMHETFDSAYSGFSREDFEERDVEIKVLGSEWKEVAEQFVAKKHHNVSHLKEFGVIFLNPVREDSPGKMLRDFALLGHYFHEIAFYSKLFKKHADRPDFATHLKAFLRGDVREAQDRRDGEWLIVQQYLWKLNPKDERLFLPRVNPESLHWHRAERDLAEFKSSLDEKFDLKIWNDEDWVGKLFENRLVSFDLEDSAMGFVSFSSGKAQEYFNYHQREALWTKIFSEYVGGEEAVEALLLKNYERGIISL